MTQKLYYQPTDDVPYPFTHMVRRNGIDEDRAFHWIICKGSILDEGFVNFLILLMEEVDKLDGVEALLPTWEERGRFYEKLKHPFYRTLDRENSPDPDAPFDVCSGIYCTTAYNLLAPKIVPDLYNTDRTEKEPLGFLAIHPSGEDRWRRKLEHTLQRYGAEPSSIDTILGNQDQWLRARPLKRFDFVYCYGVLMHTGDLKKASEHIFSLSQTAGGKVFFAIYNPHYWPEHKSEDYLNQKREYLDLPEWAKQIWDIAYMFGELHQPILKLMDSMDAVGRSLFIDVLNKHKDKNREVTVQGRVEATKNGTLSTLYMGSDFDKAIDKDKKGEGCDEHGRCGKWEKQKGEKGKGGKDGAGKDGTDGGTGGGDKSKDREDEEETEEEKEARKKEQRLEEGKHVPVQPTTATAGAPSVVFSSWMSTLQRTKALRDVLLHQFGAFTSGRGMSFFHDARDALGGWPVEFATEEDVAKIYAEIQIFGYPGGARFVSMEKGSATTPFLASGSFGAIHDYDGLVKTTEIFGRDENIEIPDSFQGGPKETEEEELKRINHFTSAALGAGVPLAPRYVAIEDHAVTSRALPLVEVGIGGEAAVKTEWSRGSWERPGHSFIVPGLGIIDAANTPTGCFSGQGKVRTMLKLWDLRKQWRVEHVGEDRGEEGEKEFNQAEKIAKAIIELSYKPARAFLATNWDSAPHGTQLKSRFWQFRESAPGITEPLEHRWTYKGLLNAQIGLKKHFDGRSFNGVFDFFMERDDAFPISEESIASMEGKEVDDDGNINDADGDVDPFALWRSRWPNFFSIAEVFSRSCFGSWSRMGRLYVPTEAAQKFSTYVDELASGAAAFRSVTAEIAGLNEKSIQLPINKESDAGFVQHTLQLAVNILLEQLSSSVSGFTVKREGEVEKMVADVMPHAAVQGAVPLYPPPRMINDFKEQMEEIYKRVHGDEDMDDGKGSGENGKKPGESTMFDAVDYDELDSRVLRVALTHLHYHSLLHVLKHRLNYHRADIVSKVTKTKAPITAQKMTQVLGSSLQHVLKEYRESFKAGQVEVSKPYTGMVDGGIDGIYDASAVGDLEKKSNSDKEGSQSDSEKAQEAALKVSFPADKQCFVVPLTWLFRKWLPKNLDALSSEDLRRLQEMYYAGPELDLVKGEIMLREKAKKGKQFGKSGASANIKGGGGIGDGSSEDDEDFNELPSPLLTSFPRDISLLSPDGKLELHSPANRMDYTLIYEENDPSLSLFPAHLATTQRATEDSRQKLAEDDVAYDFVSNGLSFCDELSDKHDINRGKPQYRSMQFEIKRKSSTGGLKTVYKTAAIVFKLRDAERLFSSREDIEKNNLRPALLEILFEWRDRIALESCFFDEEYRWTEFCRRKRFIAEEHGWLF